MKRLVVTAIFFVTLLAAFFYWNHISSQSSSAKLVENADYFDLLRHAQENIRKAPDHLPAQYEAIIANKAPEKLIHFVRERFDVIPPWKGWQAANSLTVWGTHGTLRAGAGTPRELADLLAEGLQKMGYKASVVSIKSPQALRSLKRKPFTSSDYTFDLDPYKKIDGLDLPSVPLLQDKELFWQNLYDAIPENSWEYRQSFSAKKSARLPSVLLSLPSNKTNSDSENKTVNKIVNLWSQNESPYHPSSVGYSSIYHTQGQNHVTMSLFMKTDDYRWHKMPKLLEAKFSQEKLAGGRIKIGFAPVVNSPEELLITKPANISNFLPYLKLEGGDPSVNEDERRVTGSVITSRGDVVTVAEDGTSLNFGDHKLASGGDPKAVQQVIIRKMSASNYPWLSFSFDPLDATELPVEALSGSDFSVNVNGEPALMQLTANTRTPPKIIFLIDGSASVAPEYRSKKLNEIVGNMARAIQTDYPKAKFQVFADSGLDFNGQWKSDPVEIGKKAAAVGPTRNHMWTSVIKASKLKPDAIIFFTDGNDVEFRKDTKSLPYDDLPQLVKNRLLGAAPTFTLGGARPPKFLLGASFEDIPQATGGKAFKITDHEAAISAIRTELRRVVGTYRGWIKAPDEPETTTLTLDLTMNSQTDTTVVKVPQPEARQDAPSLTGLYLHIKRPGQLGSFHRLAGTPYGARSQSNDAQNARMGLFGSYTLIAEAGTPSLSQILDDTLSARLSWESAIEAVDKKAALKALSNVKTLPRSAFAYNVPVPQAYDAGLRFWLDAEQRIVQGEKEFNIKRTDIIPLRLFSTEEDTLKERKAIFMASAQLNNLESALHGDNSFDCLTAPYSYTHAYNLQGGRGTQLNSMVKGYKAHTYLVPETGEITCTIGVNSASGAALFINSFGGAGLTVAEVKERFNRIHNILDMAGIAGGMVDAWATLEQAKMKILREATIAIMTLQAPDMNALSRELGCDALNKGAGPLINSGMRRVGGPIAESAWRGFDRLNKIAKALGLGGVNTNLPIPGCP